MIVSKNEIKKQLNKDELNKIAHLMVEAFKEHPVLSKVFSNSKSLEILFTCFLKVINNEGDILLKKIDGEIIGVLTFMEPKNGEDINFIRLMKYSFFDTMKFLVVSFRDIRRIINYLNNYSQKEHIQGKNIHLLQAAVLPEFKGKGFMSELFHLADDYYSDYDAVVLETTDQFNVGLYEHLGYNQVQKIKNLMIFKKDMED